MQQSHIPLRKQQSKMSRQVSDLHEQNVKTLSKFANFSQKYASDFTESQPTTSATPTILNTTENNSQARITEGKKINDKCIRCVK